MQDSEAGAAQTVSFSLKVTAVDGTVLLENQANVEKGMNCLDAMKIFADVGVKEYSFGAMVESINGIKPAQDEFLKLFIDGKEAMTGISDCKTDKSIAVEWKIDKIRDYGG